MPVAVAADSLVVLNERLRVDWLLYTKGREYLHYISPHKTLHNYFDKITANMHVQKSYPAALTALLTQVQ